MDDLGIIFAVAFIGWFWIDSLKARETAIAICRDACVVRDLQLLDQTVALRRLGIAWGSEGVRWRRVYRFEFSEEQVTRRDGYLVLRGARLEELSFGLPEQPDDA